MFFSKILFVSDICAAGNLRFSTIALRTLQQTAACHLQLFTLPMFVRQVNYGAVGNWIPLAVLHVIIFNTQNVIVCLHRVQCNGIHVNTACIVLLIVFSGNMRHSSHDVTCILSCKK